MEIIKKGRLPSRVDPVHDGTCHRCGTVIRFHDSERAGVSLSYATGTHHATYPCPVCFEKIRGGKTDPDVVWANWTPKREGE